MHSYLYTTKKFASSAFLFSIVMGLAGCAQAPKVPGLKLNEYRQVALVQQSVPGLIVEYRYRPGSAPNGYVPAGGGRSGAFLGSLVVGLLEVATENMWIRQRDEFNQAAKVIDADLPRRLQNAFAEQLSERLKRQVPTLQIRPVTIELNYLPNELIEARHLRLMQKVREQCPTCDMALTIDPAFGYFKRSEKGYRAHAECQFGAYDIRRALGEAAVPLASVQAGAAAPTGVTAATSNSAASTGIKTAPPIEQSGPSMQAKFTEEADFTYEYPKYVDLKDDAAAALRRLPSLTAILAEKVMEGLIQP